MINATLINQSADAISAAATGIKTPPMQPVSIRHQLSAIAVESAAIETELVRFEAEPPPDLRVSVPISGQRYAHNNYGTRKMGWFKWGKQNRIPKPQPVLPWRLPTVPQPAGEQRLLWRDTRWAPRSELYISTPYIGMVNGSPQQMHMIHNAGNNMADAVARVNSLPITGGVYGSAVISPYVTGIGHGVSEGTPDAPKGPAAVLWFGQTILFLYWDGTSVAFAGKIPKDPIAPFDKAKPDDWYQWVGVFPDGYPKGIGEGTDYEFDRKIIFLSDWVLGCVWKVHRVTKDPATWTWTKFTTGLLNPTAIRPLKDGRLFIVDERGLYEINKDTGAATQVMAGLLMMFLRVNSKQKLIVGDRARKFVEVDPDTKAVRVIHPGFGRELSLWLSGDICRHDYFAPIDTIYFVTGTGTGLPAANTMLYRLDPDGTVNQGGSFPSSGGKMPHGLMSAIHDGEADHYPWTCIIDPVLPIMYTAGYGSSGIAACYPRAAEMKNFYNDAIYTAGDIYGMLTTGSARTGSTLAWPMGIRPSFTASWTPDMQSFFQPCADELALLTDEEFTAYFQGDKIDGVKRPELGELQISYLRWWVDLCSPQRIYNNIPPRVPVLPADRVAPVISGIRTINVDGTLSIIFSTDKPAVCFALLGQLPGKYARSRVESDAGIFTTVHEVLFENCDAGRGWNFQIGAQSKSGYLRKTNDIDTNGTQLVVFPENPNMRWFRDRCVELRPVSTLLGDGSIFLGTTSHNETAAIMSNVGTPTAPYTFLTRRFVEGAVVHILEAGNGASWRSPVTRAGLSAPVPATELTRLGIGPLAHTVEVIVVDNPVNTPPDFIFPTCGTVPIRLTN